MDLERRFKDTGRGGKGMPSDSNDQVNILLSFDTNGTCADSYTASGWQGKRCSEHHVHLGN